MDLPSASNGVQQYVSPDSNAKLSQHSPAADDDHDTWSAGEGSSADDAARSQTGASKRKRPLSVSCETCKQRKVKCDRGQPSCGWCLKNHSTCTYLPRKKPGLRAGYGRELESRLGESIPSHCLPSSPSSAAGGIGEGARPPGQYHLGRVGPRRDDARAELAESGEDTRRKHSRS
jgi:hypothetical protein